MLDISIPKEIRGFEIKTFGPFTTRQMKCGVVAAALAIVMYSAEKALLGTNNPPLFPLLVPAAPCFFLGWGESFLHMKPEDYVRYVWIPNRKRSPNRKYVTENYNPLVNLYKEDLKKKQKEKQELLKENSKKNKKNKEKLVIPKELEAELLKL